MTSDAVTKDFSEEILKAHNQYRAKHGSPNLKLSEKLNKFAQEWSDNLAKKDKAAHRPDNPYGENIYMGMSSDANWKLTGDTVVTAWYDEIKSYKFGERSPKNTGEVGHFTQLLWKDSAELGIGAAKSKSGKVYVVCNYDPPGNVIPDFDKNVLAIRKTSKNENDIALPVLEENGPENIVVSPSQENLGIQFLEPNLKIVESMERLYAVPSEKIRVWSVWVTKVEEKAHEWYSWLRSHLNLVLRMSQHLRRAEEAIREDEPTGMMRSHSGEQYRKDVAIEVEKASMAADAERRSEKLSGEIRTSTNQDAHPSQGEMRSSMPGTITTEEAIETEDEKKRAVSSAVAKRKSNRAEEMAEASSTELENRTSKEANDDTMDGNKDENERKMSGDHQKETKEDEMEQELKKIAWPIGVPWEPVAQAVMEETEVPKKKEQEVEVIAIPKNEEDMERLIKDVKEQATIFRSLYKHWLEVADKAVKEVMNRTVMHSDSVPTNEEVPYFFHVNTEPDIEIGVEHDDEKILLADTTRERIVTDFTTLYFNLEDKPGKG